MARPSIRALIGGVTVALLAGPVAARPNLVIATQGELGFAYRGEFHASDLWAGQLEELFGEPERRVSGDGVSAYLDGSEDRYYSRFGMLATVGPGSGTVRRVVFFLRETGPFSAAEATLDTGLSPGASPEEAVEVYGAPFERRELDPELDPLLGGSNRTVFVYRGDYFAGSRRMFKLGFVNGALTAVSLLDEYVPHVEGLPQ